MSALGLTLTLAPPDVIVWQFSCGATLTMQYPAGALIDADEAAVFWESLQGRIKQQPVQTPGMEGNS